eukprot:CAMPEP_0179292406 /NCGR_PEP_ID=MMETSP0797-20121207/42839_1 /TAXON_ID=47934 /ORGANISM="Dinophysis acuminata, Strain DAEP01" /LENGTH=48 /DNA_ID= /DNA_START= /DNA_END= /DNA_ORIENTATION=
MQLPAEDVKASEVVAPGPELAAVPQTDTPLPQPAEDKSMQLPAEDVKA